MTMPSADDFPDLKRVLRARRSNADLQLACRQLAQALATVEPQRINLFDILKLIGPHLRQEFGNLIALQPADRLDVLRTLLAQ